jgi:enoyl-CoA hydratase/carnithine racemase
VCTSNGGGGSVEKIRVERSGAVATVVLCDPPHNPLSMAMVDRLEEVIPQLGSDRAVRAVVITGAGDRTFSVGADIREFGKAAMDVGMRAFIDQRLRVMAAVENLPKPVVCAIRGACVGGGLELALSCHFRIAAEGARLGLPEIELGIVPAWSGTQRLTRTVGRAHALDLMLRARKIGAEEAHRIGLVHEVCTAEVLLDRAQALAGELAEKPPLAVAGILEAVIQGGPLPLEEGLALEYRAVERTAGSRDAVEGVRAFFEKRKPVFKGE